MSSMRRLALWAVAGAAALLPPAALAVGEELIDAIMRSDFLFDRGVSNVPFPPLAELRYDDFSEARFDGDCGAAECRFEARQLSLAAGLPVWVGQKNMVIAGGAVSYNWLDGQGDQRVYDAGFLGAWVGQPSAAWQVGAFAFPQWHAVTDGGADGSELIAGAVGRRRHSPTFHTYYGLVWINGEPDQYLLPYFGFDWFPSPTWVVSMVMPWPAVSWGPDPDQLVRFGVSPAGASWQFDDEGRSRTADLSRWNLGLSYERRLAGRIWWGAGGGISGLGSLRISGDDGLDLTEGIGREPYLEFFLRYHPEI